MAPFTTLTAVVTLLILLAVTSLPFDVDDRDAVCATACNASACRAQLT